MIHDQEIPRQKGRRNVYTYNAGIAGRIDSIMFELAPELTPSIGLFTYTTGTDELAHIRAQGAHCPQRIILLLEYYPYTQALLHSISENIAEQSPFDHQLIDYYPLFGYLKVHYLMQTASATYSDFPKNLHSEAELTQLLNALGLDKTSEIGYQTEGFVDLKTSFDNFQYNFDLLIKNKMITPLARYLPVQIGFDAWSAMYRDIFSHVSSQYNLAKVMLFVNRLHSAFYRDAYGAPRTALSPAQAAQKIYQETESRPILIPEKGTSLSAENVRYTYEQVGIPVLELLSPTTESPTTRASQEIQHPISHTPHVMDTQLFQTQIHLSEETFYPQSIHKCIYLAFMNKLKSLDLPLSAKTTRVTPITPPQTNAQPEIGTIAELKQHLHEGLSTVLGPTAHNTLQKNVTTCTQSGATSAVSSLPTVVRSANYTFSFSSKDITNAVSSGDPSGGGIVSAFFPAIQSVLRSASTIGDVVNDPKNLYHWNQLAAECATNTQTGLALASYFSSAASHAAFYASSVIHTVIHFTALVNQVKALKDLRAKKQKVADILGLVQAALVQATSAKMQPSACYGATISTGLLALIKTDLADLERLVGFLIVRYDLRIADTKQAIAKESWNLAVALICGALFFVTAGASIPAATFITGLTNLAIQTVDAPLKLSRYKMKSLQYNLKYAQVQQDLSTSDSDPTRRMLAKRDLFLLKQASTLSGKHRYQYRIAQFFTAKPKPQLAELQQLDGKIVSGATIDDYQRIKIASFILSSLVRNQYYQQLMLENPGVTAYLGIAQAMGECIDFKEDAPEINKILSCPLILGSNLQHYAHTKQMLDSAYQTALQTVAGKIP